MRPASSNDVQLRITLPQAQIWSFISSNNLSDLVQLERPIVLALILTQDMNLPARDLVALDRAFLGMEGAHVAHEGLGDVGR
jgi:hypothetical protein